MLMRLPDNSVYDVPDSDVDHARANFGAVPADSTSGPAVPAADGRLAGVAGAASQVVGSLGGLRGASIAAGGVGAAVGAHQLLKRRGGAAGKVSASMHSLTPKDIETLPAFKDAAPGDPIRRMRYEIERYGKPGSAAATAASAPGASAPGAPAGLPLNAEPQVPTREMLGMSKSGDLAQQVRLQKWRQFVQGRRSDILTRELEDAGKSTVGVPRAAKAPTARLAASAEGNVAGEIVPAVQLGQKATPTQRGASGRVLAQRAKGLAALPEGESDLARQMQKSLALEKLMTERGIPQAERAGLRAGVAMAERGALGPALRGVAHLGGPAVEILLAILNARDLPAQMDDANRMLTEWRATHTPEGRAIRKALATAPHSL